MCSVVKTALPATELDPQMTMALGLKCTKDTLDWAVIEGTDRPSAKIVDSKRVTAPSGSRGEQLVWIRKEVQELLHRYPVDEVVLRAVEAGGKGNSLPRAEAEGVVQEAVAATGATCRRVLAASMRSAFSVKTGKELDNAVTSHSIVAGVPKSRQDPVTAALVPLEA